MHEPRGQVPGNPTQLYHLQLCDPRKQLLHSSLSFLVCKVEVTMVGLPLGWAARRINDDEGSNNDNGSPCDLWSQRSAAGICEAHSVCSRFSSELTLWGGILLTSSGYR